MKKILPLILFLTSIHAFAQFQLVKNGKSKVAILVPAKLSKEQRTAIDDFKKTIQKSSGAEIPEFSKAEDEKVSAEFSKIIIGPSEFTDKILGEKTDVQPEEFKILPRKNYLVILAKDIIRPEYAWSII
jgi:hypothetical protein